MIPSLGVPVVAKKKVSKSAPKRYGTLIRVTDEFAEAIKKAANFKGISISDYANDYLLAAVEKDYRDSVTREAKRIEGQSRP